MNMKSTIGNAAVIATIVLALGTEALAAQAGHMHRATRRRTAVVVSSATHASDDAAATSSQAAATQSTAAQQSATAQQQSATAAQQSATAQQQTAAAATKPPPLGPPGQWRSAPSFPRCRRGAPPRPSAAWSTTTAATTGTARRSRATTLSM